MKIIAKASLDAEEINEKIRCGCDGIEYNLEKDFIELGKAFEENYPHEVFHLKNVEAVHTPFYKDGQAMLMERVFQHQDISDIENVFRLAQYCAEIWKHRILIVIHSSLSMYDFMQFEIFRLKLEEDLGRLFHQYPDVDMAVENVVMVEYREKQPYAPMLCNGTFWDAPQIIGYLRQRFGERVGTVLDICHAMMTDKYMTAFLKMADFLPDDTELLPEKVDFSLEHYFQLNQGICKLIHFNNFVGNGYQRNHGTGFKTQEKVDQILDLYREYKYECPLTIEIREEDYHDCINYRETKEKIMQWVRKNEI